MVIILSFTGSPVVSALVNIPESGQPVLSPMRQQPTTMAGDLEQNSGPPMDQGLEPVLVS